MGLAEVMDRYNKGDYRSAFKDVGRYLESYPRDDLAMSLEDMIRMTLAENHMKKAYTLLAEGLDRVANQELEKAIEYHPKHTKKVEERFTLYLKENSKAQAANRILYDLLRDPSPSEDYIYRINKRLRERRSDKLAEMEKIELERLKNAVEKLIDKGKWNEAVDLINDYLMSKPDDPDAKDLLQRVNRLAAEDFYNKAVEYFEKAKTDMGNEVIGQARQYDPVWYRQKVDELFKQARMSVSMGEMEKAKQQFEILRSLQSKNKEYLLYLEVFDQDIETLFEKSMKLYDTGEYLKASVWFDFLRLRRPDNKQAHLYYHLSAAWRFIKERDLDKIKEHLVLALEIDPGKKDALTIFDRLQDVLEIMGSSH